MTKNQLPLEMLIELAQEEVNEAGQKMQHLVGRINKAKEQMGALQQYQMDYKHKLRVIMQDGMRSSECRNYQGFISGLDQAILEQTRIVKTLDEHLTAARHVWMEKQRKLMSFEALEKRQRQRKAVRENKREQNLMDEFGARSHQQLSTRMAF